MKKPNLFFAPLSEHGERPHAILSMSQADRFMTCPGSVMLSANLPPSKSSSAAEEGTFAHGLSEVLLRNRVLKKKEALPAIPEEYDTRMLELCEAYAGMVCALTGDTHIEVALDFKGLHHNLGGTSDVVNIDGPVMRVIDLKFGRAPVSAKDNAQLLGYAVGARKTFDVRPESIELMIYQPRAKHSRHTVTAAELDAFEAKLQAAAILTDDPFAPLQMTDKGCFWCRAKPICPEYAKVAKAAVRAEFATPAPKKNTPSAIAPANLLDSLELAQKLAPWCAAVVLQAKDALATDPEALPGYSLKPGRKMAKWDDEESTLLELKGLINCLDGEARDLIASALFTPPGLQAPGKVRACLEDMELMLSASTDVSVLEALKAAANAAFTETAAASSLVKVKGLE